MLATLAIVYLQTAGVLYQETARKVTAVAEQLVARFDEGGSAAMVEEITRALSVRQNANDELYLLTDPLNRVLAGNLDALPQTLATPTTGERRAVTRGGQPVTAFVVVRELPDGNTLVVGNDLRDQQTIETLVTKASATAVGMIAVLLVGGIFLFNRELDRRVEIIRRTLAAVAAGQLMRRVALTGEEDEFSLLGNDINRMLDQIEKLMDGVRHVSDTIAHNLRTPLTRILLGVRAVANHPATDVALQHKLARVIQDVEGLTTVFEKLLQISETEAGARRRQFETVALHVIAGDVRELYEAVAEAQGATLDLAPTEPALVLGDPDLLAGALANLVDNALKFAGVGAKVVVGIVVHHGSVVLSVSDNGPGIIIAARAHLGARFLRLDPALPGHGLGLASVRATVALHGGQIRFENAAPGLRVEVELPLQLHPANGS
ncbi:MAG: HAMP domain-containing sensor histidine kinase [Burkholderiaceae bacterium]